MNRNEPPKIVLMMQPVDGGRAVIGLIECPNCGQQHFTTDLRCGKRKVFCGREAEAADGYSWVDIERII